MKSVSILVVSWNGREHLTSCLPSLLEQRVSGVEIEILVLDNGSTDGTAELVERSFPTVKLVRSATNLGFAAGNNLLAESARGDALALLNNDARAEPDWLAALVDALSAAAADVAGVAGRIVDWEGERLDFGRGIVTFDGHALALDCGRDVASARLPLAGEELLFGCGGNLLVRRAAFLDAGGFDPSYFAYFEDVDLGWRLWAGGERLVACPDAVVRHRGSATSQRLTNGRRGALFERNAFWTVIKSFDDELRSKLLPVVLLTFLSRLDAMMKEEPVGGAALAAAGVGTAAEERGEEASKERLADKYRRFGPTGFVRRGSARALRDLASWLAPTERRADRIEVASDRTLAQLRALTLLLSGLDRVEGERARLAVRRRRSDREIVERFPLWIVPTYPGDERLFASEAFASWLPSDLRFERAALDQVVTL